jgi:hypothetical protein
VAKAAASEFRRAGFAVLQYLLSGYYDGFWRPILFENTHSPEQDFKQLPVFMGLARP